MKIYKVTCIKWDTPKGKIVSETFYEGLKEVRNHIPVKIVYRQEVNDWAGDWGSFEWIAYEVRRK